MSEVKKFSQLRIRENLITFIAKKQKLILTIGFLFTLFIPLSPTRLNNLLTLTDQSIMQWVTSFNGFFNIIFAACFQLIGNGIDRSIKFTQELFNFYIQVGSLNFSIINSTGYLLTAINILIPLLFIYSLIVFIKNVRKSQTEEKILFYRIRSLSPRTLIFILLVIPFPTDYIWLGALLAIILVIFWFIVDIRELMITNKELSIFEVISWKKTILLLFTILILVISIVEFLTGEIFSVSSLSGLNPNFILLASILIFIIISSIWIAYYAKNSGKDIIEVLKEKYKEYSTPRHLILYLLGISIGIPIYDTLLLRTSASDLVLVGLNLPWLVGLLLHDPFSFFGTLITTTQNGFDTIIDAAREISRGLIPVVPTAVSIIGSFQPTIFLTLLIFALFVLIYSFILVGIEIEWKFQLTEKDKWKRILSKYGVFGVIVVICLVFAVIAFIFEPSNYQTIYGDKYELNTDPWSGTLLLGISLFIVGVILSVIFWGAIQVRKGRSWRIITTSILINGLAIVIAIIMVVPFIYMLKNSVQTNFQNTKDFQTQGLIPDPFTTSNYAQLFGLVEPPYETMEYRVITWLFNSIITAGLVTAFLVIFSAMAGYCLAKRDFIGRKLIFALTIAIQMVPPYVQIIPLYLELNRLGFVGSLLGVILPFLIQPFSIFLCAEFMRGIPDDYLDAARIDGYSEFQIFRKVVIPLSIPVLSVMIIINIIGNWNAFIWPLLLLERSENAPFLRTLPLGMYNINAELQEQMGVILALATVIVIPIFIILFLAQDYIKRGVTIEGLKG